MEKSKDNSCQIVDDGTCITDGAGKYDINEHCTAVALVDMIVSAVKPFNLEPGYDFITINGTKYTSTKGPKNVLMKKDDKLFFDSDSYITREGFKICGIVVPTPVTPVEPSPSPEPPSPEPVCQNSRQVLVNHQYDNPGHKSCECVWPGDPCLTDMGPQGAHCIPDSGCASICLLSGDCSKHKQASDRSTDRVAWAV